MTVALTFVGGDEIVEPFILQGSDGSIIDITSVTLSAAIWWRGRSRIPLVVGAGLGIEIVSNFPATAAEGSPQDPHGFVRITEAQSVLIPRGQIASLRLVAVDGSGVTMSSFFYPLERIQ